MNKKPLLMLVASLFSTSVLADNVELNPIVVTATRSAVNSFDAPASVDVVDQSVIENAGAGMTLSESINRIAGVTAESRNQFAQDPQISIRGFGSRSNFGVTGVRLYVDGIPLTMPDGIGQPGNIDFETVKSIEVLKGPFATMYGNGAGGVISLTTKTPPTGNEVSASFLAGSYGTTKESAQATGTVNGIGYLFNESNFNTDGYRQHSAAHKKQSTAEFSFDLLNDTHVTILADYMKMEAQDPLGLAGRGSSINSNIPNVYSNPQSVPTAALAANTRVSRENTQAGINLEHIINDNNSINIVTYAGHRNNAQFLSTVTSSGVGKESTISRDFVGADINWANKGEIFSKNYSLTSGISYSHMSDDRMDFTATNGSVSAAQLASPKRNETDNSMNFDEYVQAKLSILNNLDLNAGVRNIHSIISFNPNVPGQTNTSASAAQFSNTTPSIGLLWKVREDTNAYVNYGKGFQTPNSIQMAYKDSFQIVNHFNTLSSYGLGPNTNLSASTSDNYELGLKTYLNENTRLNLALFRIVTNNEIAVDFGGAYVSYANVPVQTSRNGLEISLDSKLQHNFNTYAAYTYMDARYDGTFRSNSLGTISSGNTIPGTFKNQLYGELSWMYPSLGFTTAVESVNNSKTYANDTNTAYASGYSIVNIRAGFKQEMSNWRFSEYARVDNLFDRDYISAVRINDSNGEFYEAGAGRNYIVGLSASYRF
jgi:iron complex outermembrane receptor protein